MPYVSSNPNDAFYQLIMQYSPEAAFAPGGGQVSDPAAMEWLLAQMAAQQNPFGDSGGADFSVTGYGVADRPLQPSDLPTYVPPPATPPAPTGGNEGGGGGGDSTFTSNVYAPKPVEPIPSPLPNQLFLPLPAEPVMPYPEGPDPRFQGPMGPVIDMGFKIPIDVTGKMPVETVPSPLPNKLPPPPNQGPPPGSQGDPGNPPPTNPPATGEKPSNPLGQIAAAALPFMASQGQGGGLAVPMTAPVVGTSTMQNSLFPLQQQGVPIPGNLFSFIKGGFGR